MKDNHKLLVYIIVNIVISALTTSIVLWGWGHIISPAKAASPPINTNCLPPSAEFDEIPPIGQTLIKIENVFGMADLEKEVVVLKRVGSGDLYLSGWKLSDGNGHTYTFPRFLLNQEGAIQVYTRLGTDSAITLYWGLPEPMWRSGSTVRLYDPLNQLRAEYTIP